MKIRAQKTRTVFDRYNIVSTDGVRAAVWLTEGKRCQGRAVSQYKDTANAETLAVRCKLSNLKLGRVAQLAEQLTLNQ
jgi:hypothetical protein